MEQDIFNEFMKLLRDIYPERTQLGGSPVNVINYIVSLSKYINSNIFGVVDKSRTNQLCINIANDINEYVSRISSDVRSSKEAIDTVQTYNYVIGIMEIVAERTGNTIPEEYYWFGDDDGGDANANAEPPKAANNPKKEAKQHTTTNKADFNEEVFMRMTSVLERIDQNIAAILDVITKN